MKKSVIAIIVFALILSAVIFFFPKQEEILLSPGVSGFSLPVRDNTIVEVWTTTDTPVNFNLLYRDGDNFTIVGGASWDRIATSDSQTLKFYQKKDSMYHHSIFIASDDVSRISYLLHPEINQSEDGVNYTTIYREVNLSWKNQTICENKTIGETCSVGNIVLTISEINYTKDVEESVTFQANAGTVFNKTFDNQGNYFVIPDSSIFPTNQVLIEVFDILDEPAISYLLESTDLGITVTNLTCYPNWTAHYDSTSVPEQNITYYVDENDCGIESTRPENETTYYDHDNNGIIGNVNSITEDNFDRNDLEIRIGDEELNVTKNYSDEGEEIIQVLEDDDVIIEFVYDFDDGPINFYDVTIKKQSFSSEYGFLIVSGLDIEKTVYVDRKNSTSSAVCVEDRGSVDDVSDISDECDRTGEKLIGCPGEEDGIACLISGDYFEVSGLEHSGVKEYIGDVTFLTFSCVPNWTYSAWSACNSSGQQTRTATDLNNCGTIAGREALIRNCTYTPSAAACTPDWDCTSWAPEECPKNETQTRTCTDLNNCGTSAGKPSETKSCVYEGGSTILLVIIIFVVLILFVIGAVVAYFLLKKDDSSDGGLQKQKRGFPTYSNAIPVPGPPKPPALVLSV